MLKVLSYNIHSGVGMDGKQSYARIGKFLAEQNVDIALLQEMDTRDSHRSTQHDEQAICANHFTELAPSPTLRNEHGWYGNAILSRYPIVHRRSVDTSQDTFQPRNIQEAVINIGDSLVRVINTHKGLKKLERRRQLEILNTHLSHHCHYNEKPIVMAGDFNEWQLFTNAFRHIDNILTPHRVSPTFPTRWPLFRLDRAWSRPSHLIAHAKVLKTPETKLYSDHLPILLSIDTRALEC